MRSFRHPWWQHLDYRVKVATTQENKPPTQGTRQWTFTTPRWRCGSILLPSLNAGVPEPTGGKKKKLKTFSTTRVKSPHLPVTYLGCRGRCFLARAGAGILLAGRAGLAGVCRRGLRGRRVLLSRNRWWLLRWLLLLLLLLRLTWWVSGWLGWRLMILIEAHGRRVRLAVAHLKQRRGKI